MTVRLNLVRAYAGLSFAVWTRTGRNLPGLGRALRTIRHAPRVKVHGATFEVSPEDADCYARLVIGEWTEPETHTFLSEMVARSITPVRFVDVGSNVGEFVIAMALHPRVSEVSAFEPTPSLVRATRRSLALNPLAESKVSITQAAVSSESGTVTFEVRANGRNGARVGRGGATVPSVRIDDCVQPHSDRTTIILVDVEGHELEVLRGASTLRQRDAPIWVVEFNHVTRAHFTLEALRQELGSSVEIFRLRPDGRLDRDLSRTWNIVLVPEARLHLVAGLVVAP